MAGAAPAKLMARMRVPLFPAGWTLCALVAAGAAAQQPARSTPPAGRGVLIVAIDGLRADHLSCAGYDRPTTPEMDRLAREGLGFEQAFATAPWLLPSHVSLFTGCDPNVARRALDKQVERQVERIWFVPERVPHLAVEFLASGYQTCAVVDHPWLSAVYGFATGFQRFERNADAAEPSAQQGLGAGGRRVLQWLRGLERGQPWFAYLHSHDLERIWSAPDPVRDTYFHARPELDFVPPVSNFEPCFHAIPPSRWDGGAHTLGEYEARYDGALCRLDEELGKLREGLQQIGRLDSTTIALVGTFGVQFGEAGLYLDHGALSVADLHVPLILRPGRQARAGGPHAPSSAVVSTVDLAPTLLELEGLPVPRGMHGHSLLAQFANGPTPPPEPRDFAIATGGLQQGYALFGTRWCMEILYPESAATPALVRSWYGRDRSGEMGDYRETIYDRFATPFPRPGSAQQPPPEVAQRMRQAAARWVVYTGDLRQVLHPPIWWQAPDPAKVRKLVELGYLGDDWR